MTKNFDTLLEQMLSEMAPADISGFEGGAGGAAEHIEKGIPEGEPKGHWAPMQKLPVEDRRKIIRSILDNVFSENENTYSPTVDTSEELHSAIKSAIQKVSGETELKAKGDWAAKFLADRMMTLLKGNVKYTTSGGEEVQKDMTQKEFKQALNKALEQPPTEEEAETTEEEDSEDVEMVYMKAADIETDDSDVVIAFDKLPDDKEMSYQEVISLIKTNKPGQALDLFDKIKEAGGLTEKEKEIEDSEDEEVEDLEFDSEDERETRGYETEYQSMMRDLGGASTTRKFGGSMD